MSTQRDQASERETQPSEAVEDTVHELVIGGIAKESVAAPVLDGRIERRRTRERARVALSLVALAIFGAVVLAILVGVLFMGADWDEVSGAVAAVLPPVVGICTSIITFYFAKRKSR